MFVAGIRRGYQEEFHQAVAEAMRVYAGEVSRLVATWPASSVVVVGWTSATPFIVGDDLLG